MVRSVRDRLTDVEERIVLIDALMSGRSRQDLDSDLVAVAAFERFLEIISEASRYIPEDLKRQHPEIPWRQIADIGNWLRHAYQQVDVDILWAIHRKDLDALRTAIRAMIVAVDRGTPEA